MKKNYKSKTQPEDNIRNINIEDLTNLLIKN